MKPRVPNQVLSALKLRPMTVSELIPMVNTTPEHLRSVLSALSDAGAIRRGRAAPRQFRLGAIPRYWELAA